MSLNASLSIATQALFAASAEIQTANNNIANANTPGYSREIVNLQSVAPLGNDKANPGGGVLLQGFTSVRDELLQSRIQQETQSQSQTNAELSSLQQIETVFNSSTQDIGTEMSNLFTNLSSLSLSPNSSTARQGVITAGQSLATAFNTAADALSQQQSGLNTQVSQDVSQINQLADQIAALNAQLQLTRAKGQDGGMLQDQQDQLILNLSKLTNVSVTNTESGLTISTGSGTPLVLGATAHHLQTVTGTGSMLHVQDENGNDITSSIQSGDLGGTLNIRDQVIPDLQNQLDTLANQFATAFNTAQAKGYDQNGAVGGNFFTIPSTIAGSASTIAMAFTDTTKVAASSDGSPGSNGNVVNLSAIQNAKLPSGESPVDAYAKLVYSVGNLTSTAKAQSTAAASTILQLTNQRNSVSGVSIDEESANLVTFQQSYAAAAKVISTVQQLFQVTLNMIS